MSTSSLAHSARRLSTSASHLSAFAKSASSHSGETSKASTGSQDGREGSQSSSSNSWYQSESRRAAIEAWKQRSKSRSARVENNLARHGSASYKGRSKDSDLDESSSLFEKIAQETIARKTELWGELDVLHQQLESLQNQSFSLTQKLKQMQSKKANGQSQSNDGWGPDRLAPPPTTESDWNAAPQDTQAQAPAAASIDMPSQKGKTELFSGQDILANSKLHFRDSRGKVLPKVNFTDIDANRAKRFTLPISGSITSKQVPIEKVAPLREMNVATLAHGLDRVLFNPGVYWLRDPRSGIYNFDPRLKDILDVDLFDYAALPPYTTSSKDPELAKLTQKHGKKFCGSTSSMTSLLSQCYFLVSGWRNPDTTGFSASFTSLPDGYSAAAKLPASVLLHWKDGHYAIDADKSASGEADNSNYVLTSLGKSMEKMLTSSPEEYSKYTRVNSWKLTEEERNKPEAYHYASTDKMMMRSQLDCQDDRLPRKTFDLKTRASIGIRHDRANYVEGSGYQIRRAKGVLESFEREYYDMVRAAFLKYNFQARIGHMDGIMVAYHTTSTIFGFQYIPVEEMNERLFGTQEMADQAFKLSLGMMEHAMEAATSMFPEQTVKITVDGKEKAHASMSLYVEPVLPDTNRGAESVPKEATESVTKTTLDTEEPKRTIVQLDVTVDRYMDGNLVRGPIDFTALPGRRVDSEFDDEIDRRQRQTLPDVRWEVDYRISPRPDLTEAQVRANLNTVRNKQTSLSSLILPNVESLNEREQYRMKALAENPEALERFLEERASGAAAGMPLAPGQMSAETASTRPSSKDTQTNTTAASDGQPDALDALSPAPTTKSPSELRREKIETRFVRMRNIRTMRLRELAKLGAKDAKLSLANDQYILYQSQS